MTLFRKKVEEGGLATLAAKEIEISVALTQKRVALDELEAKAGHALLDSEGAGNDTAITTQVVRARAEINALERALGVVRGMREDVIRRSYLSEAAELRKQTAGMRAELEKIAARSGELLSELSALEGIPVACVPATSATGLSRSVVLSQRMNDLDSDAGILESKKPAVDGSVQLEDATSDDAIVLEVLNNASLSPSAEQTLNWLAACEQGAIAKFNIAGFGELPRRVVIAWRDGQIDVDRSSIYVASLAPKVQSQSAAHERGFSHYDVAAGTFRSTAAA
jgi:hypothetical protein